MEYDMTFLDKLDALMAQRNWNKKRLSEESGVPYTTIDSFYKKGYKNAKLKTILAIADCFGVSLDYLMRDESGKAYEDPISAAYRSAPHSIQTAVDKLLDIETQSEPLLIAAHENPDGNGDNQHDIEEVMK